MVHQRNTFIATMDNYDKVLKYTNETINASGTSAEKFEHYMDSLEATINGLTVQWEQFIQDLDATDMFKNVIKFASTLLSVLDALTNKAPVLQSLLGGFIGFKVVKGTVPYILKMVTAISKFKGFGNPIKALTNSFKNLFGVSKMLSNVYTDMDTKLTVYQRQQAMQIMTNKNLTMEEKKQQLVNMGLNLSNIELIMSNHSLSSALTVLGQKYGEISMASIEAVLANNALSNEQKELEIKTILLTTAQSNNKRVTDQQALADAQLIVSQKGLAASSTVAAGAMSALNIAVAALSMVISIGISVWMKYKQKQEEAMDKAKEAADTYKEQADSLDEIIDKYKELYKTLKEATSLSDINSTQEELLSLQQQIVDTYGAQANGIDLVNGNLDVQLQKIREIQKTLAQAYLQNPENKIDEAVEYMQKERHRNILDISKDITMPEQEFDEISKNIKNIFENEVVSDDTSISIVFGSLTDSQYIDKLQDGIDKLNLAIEKSDNPDVIAYYENLIGKLYELRNEVQNTDDYINYSKILSDLPYQIFTAGEQFTNPLTQQQVDPASILDNLDSRIELIEQLALSGEDKIKDAITGNEVTYDELLSLLYQDFSNMDAFIDTLSDEDKAAVSEYVKKARETFFGNRDLLGVQQYLKGNIDYLTGEGFEITAENILSDKEISKLKEKSPAILKSIYLGTTEDADISEIFEKMQPILSEFEVSAEDLIYVLTSLGYTYKETEQITAAGLIENFSTDESEIKTMTENIEKLNNAVKTVASGGVLDLEDISDLRDAGVDVSALVEGGIENIYKISKLRDDYVQSQIDSLNEQIEFNNEVMKQDKNITDYERQQIEFENQMLQLRIKSIKASAEGVKTTANEYITALKSANEIIAQAQSYGDSTISEDILSDMVDQYADMAGYVEKYRLGMIDNDELLRAFKIFYQNDINNYQDYQKEKYTNTTAFYETWKKNNSDWVDEFKNKYQIDLNNAASYSAAKALILENGMSEYINVTTGELTEAGKYAITHVNSYAEGVLATTIYEAQHALNDFMDEFKDDTKEITPSIDLTNVYDESIINEITNRMKDSYELINELQTNNTQLTLDNLDAMKSTYPAMSEYVDKYLRKEMNREELISKFKEMYEQDKKNYIKAQQAKLTYSKDFYKTSILTNSEMVDKFKDQYDIDLKNFSTLYAAKQAIINAFNDENVNGIAINLEDYVDLATGEYTKEYMRLINGGDSRVRWAIPYIAQLHDLLSQTQSAAEAAVNNIENTIKETVYSIEDALSDISSILSNEVDYWEQIANGIVAAAQLEIDALDKEIDLLEKKNDEQQRQIDLQEKLEALNRAKTQRSVREYNAETGQFEWTTNKKDIETAQREYDEALEEEKKQQLEDEKEWLEKYGESFSSVSSAIESQRQINKAIQALADIRGVKASSLTYQDLLSMTDEEQATIRSKYGSAVDMNLAFEEVQNQQNINKAKANLVTGGYATNGANGFVLDYNTLSRAIGVPFTKLANSLSGYTEILKSTSFAETKPTTSTVNNITNTGAVTNSYVLSGDMTFKFDGNMDVDGFITQLVTKLDEKIAITPLS